MKRSRTSQSLFFNGFAREKIEFFILKPRSFHNLYIFMQQHHHNAGQMSVSSLNGSSHYCTGGRQCKNLPTFQVASLFVCFVFFCIFFVCSTQISKICNPRNCNFWGEHNVISAHDKYLSVCSGHYVSPKPWGNWGLGRKYSLYSVPLTVSYSCVCKVSRGSDSAFPIFDNLASRKWLVVEQNR